MDRSVYFAWTKPQPQLSAMQQEFGFEVFYLPPPLRSKVLKPFGFPVQAFRMLAIARARSPDTVWVQTPPNFVPLFALLMRAAVGRKFRIAADCHGAAFRPPWSLLPGFRALLNRCDLVLLHGQEAAGAAARLGVRTEIVQVLADEG